MTGKKFHRWTVIGTGPFITGDGASSYRCRCSCGTVRYVRLQNLIRGASRSCGCLQKEKAKGRLTKHGESMENSPEYIAWRSMKSRCLIKSATGYRNYGGRGITVCNDWILSYAIFLRDVGRRPTSGHSLERRDNNGNYEPGNVYWATKTEQSMNKRGVRLVTHNGVTKSISGWAEVFNLFPATLQYRLLVKKMSMEEAIRSPVRKRPR